MRHHLLFAAVAALAMASTAHAGPKLIKRVDPVYPIEAARNG